jgi:putative hemolysin
MRQESLPRYLLLVLIFAGLLLLAACSEAVVEATPTATPEPAAPETVVTARDAVLTFLRDAAIITVPPKGVPWHMQQGPAPAGFNVYHFDAEGVDMTVSYTAAAAEPTYHVTVTNKDIGFCWQAQVNHFGRITALGEAAQLMPELVDAAATYCQDQGYTYSVEAQPDGSECGMCTFAPDNACKAWAYYQGICGPEATATSDEG